MAAGAGIPAATLARALEMITSIQRELERQARDGDVRAQVQLALLLERAGHANAGMEWLSIAAQRNDAEALMLVGCRLVAERYGPSLVRQGVDLLIQASAGGNSEAAILLSRLSALGMHLPQSWMQALDFLVRAAELGNVGAQQELLILAGRSTGEAETRWTPLRRAIDISALLHVPAREMIHRDPDICVIPHFAEPGPCQWIVQQAVPRLQKAQVYDEDTGQRTTNYLRNNEVANFGIFATNLVNLTFQAKIASVVGVSLSFMEGASVLRYLPGQQASEHYDFLDPNVPSYAHEISRAGQRIATGLVYLGDEYEDGSTAFPRLGVEFKGEVGDALIFRNVTKAGFPDIRSEHAGRPPSGGTKWVFSNFARDRPVIGGADGDPLQ